MPVPEYNKLISSSARKNGGCASAGTGQTTKTPVKITWRQLKHQIKYRH
jgi:hypothetical protein